MLLPLPRPAAASARARSHESGSLSTNMIGTIRMRRHDPDEEQDAPAAVAGDEGCRPGRDHQAGQRAHDVAHRRQRLQRAECHRTELPRHALGDEGGRRAEHAADAEADQEAVQREVDPRRREARETGEARVDQQRDDHRLHAAEPVAHHAEDDPAGRPPEDHRGGGVAADRLELRRRLRIGAEQLAQRRLAAEDEDPLVHAVEQPAAGRDDRPRASGTV